MKLDDDDDPIFSEWSSQANAMVFPSLAPHEISLDEEFYTPVAVSPERRARLLRYVKATMACCVALCAAAMVRVGVSHVLSPSEESVPQMIVASEVTIGAEPAEPPAAPASPPHAPPDSTPIPSPPATASQPIASPPIVARPITLPATAPSAVVSPPATHAAPVTPPPSATKVARASTPLQDRETARQALERGKAKEAATAAARATAGDPGDAEAWLILGAANQELGRADRARDAFHSCVKSAKRGPVRECAAMLR
jgi:hypothetical protein